MNALNKLSACSRNQTVSKTSNHHDVLISALRLCMSRQDIAKCPMQQFDGKIHLISSDDEEQSQKNKDVLDLLLSSSVVGFDTETAVTFNRNIDPLPTALVQIAIQDHVVLWRLRKKRNFVYRKDHFPVILKNILTNEKIKKVGIGIYGDIKELYTQYHIALRNVEDNQVIAKNLGFSKVGLVSLTAQLFGWRVSKYQQLSNWEANKLSRQQLSYAATDAWASLLIYYELLSISEALQIQNLRHERTVFEEILRTEANIDTDILRILEKQRNEILRQKINTTEREKLSWSVDDYDIFSYVGSCKKSLMDSKTHFQGHTTGLLCSLIKDAKDKNQHPFLYQPT